MRTWQYGALSLGWLSVAWLAVGCGGGEETRAQAPRAQQTAGAERQVTGPIVEVDEAQLTQPTPSEVASAAAAAAGREQTAEMPAGEQPTEEMPATPSEPAGAAAGATAATPSAHERVLTITELCPTDVESLRVGTRNLTRGIALTLTARGEDEIARLRDRMRELALVHSMRRAEEQRIEAEPSAAEPTAPTAAATTPSSPLFQVDEIRLVEIPRGVRVELRYETGTEPSEVRELRTSVREDASSLREGVCPLSLQLA